MKELLSAKTKNNFSNQFSESGSRLQLEKGQRVTVVGASSKRGHLLVEHKDMTLNIPYQFLELIPSSNHLVGDSGVNI